MQTLIIFTPPLQVSGVNTPLFLFFNVLKIQKPKWIFQEYKNPLIKTLLKKGKRKKKSKSLFIL